MLAERPLCRFGKVFTVTKMQTAAASLVAAVPGGILAALSVMLFLSYSENMPMMLKVLVGATALTVSFGIVLMPIGIAVLAGKADAKPVEKKGAAKKSKGGDDSDAANEDGEVFASEELSDSEMAETVDFHSDGLEDADEIEEPTDDVDDFSDEVLLDDDTEEDEPPRKKGKKR